jgi:ATP-dependent DNA ligase
MGLEGIVSKKIDAPYAPDNRGIWVKAKCRPRQEFVIIGWTNSDMGGAFGALLLHPLETPKMPVQPFRRKAVDGARSCGHAS